MATRTELAQAKSLKLVENYIWISTLGSDGEFLIIPTWPETITDAMRSTFKETNALARSAPVFAYSNSGPRTVQVRLSLHRDMMQMVNADVSNMKIDALGDDYVDTLIKKLQSISLPKYTNATKMVEPPIVAVRFGNEIFIRGIVNGSVSVSYTKPILEGGKYAQVAITFDVTEIDPYDAQSVAEKGSFRGLTRTTDIYKEN